MQACHWKAHSMFTIFLPKRPWSDKDNNMYLGPVVAPQVLDPFPKTSHLWKERGAHSLRPSL